MARVYDVLIIGGGPAGLAMAVTLARQVYSALVIDSHEYRNARATNMHNVPGFDHVPPAEYRAKVRKDLAARYKSIEFQDGTKIVEVRQRPVDQTNQNGTLELAEAKFEAVDAQGNVYYGRKVGLATGVRDKVEDELEGFADCWGRGIFHCLFCDGFEECGAASVGVVGVGLLSSAALVAHVGLLAKRLSAHLTLYTDGDAQVAAASLPKSNLSADKITVETRKIARVAMKNWPAESTVVVTFADGTTREEGFLSGAPLMEQAAPFAEQLGLEMGSSGGPMIALKGATGETSVPGVFAAGDAAVVLKSVVQATYTGQMAGVGMVKEVAQELEAADEL
ncbi:hypothetical protein PWT90_02284 [Aphanocladium album]|nr:hypothetical protein PWT90_02284 [Aphanocladium album]